MGTYFTSTTDACLCVSILDVETVHATLATSTGTAIRQMDDQDDRLDGPSGNVVVLSYKIRYPIAPLSTPTDSDHQQLPL